MELNTLLDELQRTAAQRDANAAHAEALAEALEWLALGAMSLSALADPQLTSMVVDMDRKPTEGEAHAIVSLFTARHGALLAYAQLRPLRSSSGVRRASTTFAGGTDLEAPDLADTSWRDMAKMTAWLLEHGMGPGTVKP